MRGSMSHNIKEKNNNMKLGFLKGFYDSEGFVISYKNSVGKTTTRGVGFVQKDLNTINLISYLLSEFRIKNKITTRLGSGFMDKSNKYYYLTIHDKLSIHNFQMLIDFRIERKKINLNSMVKTFIFEKNCLDCNTLFKPNSSQQVRCGGCKYFHALEYQRDYYKKFYSVEARNNGIEHI